MAGDFAKVGLAGVLLVVIAMILLVLLGPTIHAMQEAVKIAQFEAKSRHAELAEFLRSELRNTRIADPYDARWWGKRLNGKQYNQLENALNDFLNDTELDGQAEAALYEALRQAGIHVTNLADAVHAANHLVNGGKVKDGEPLPEQIKEDYHGTE